MATPRDFPILSTARERHDMARGRYNPRPYHTCRVCGLTVDPRNSRRHNTKCARLKREDLALWSLWRMDMHGSTMRDIRKRLGPKLLAELVGRGIMVQGPLTRKGEL